MRRATQMVLAAGVLGGATVGATLLGGLLFLQNLSLREELALSRATSEQALERERARGEEVAAAREAAAKQQERLLRLEKDLASAKAAPVEGPTNGPARAVRASIFLGRETIGQGWLLPPNGTGASGKTVPEAVVVLDESMRPRLGLARKEPEVADAARSVTVNHNYTPSSYGTGWWWPTYWVGTVPVWTNRPSHGDGRFPSPPPRETPGPPPSQGSGIWRPSERPFLPSPSPWPIMTPPQRSVGPAMPSAPRVSSSLGGARR